ncbi:CHAT domain-containing protein [Nostoc sp.]|uniref:CHAT domain-containing protein n=1 Tax=Nostoc sp. TaxID=1180 RepID=UPI002FEEF9FF
MKLHQDASNSHLLMNELRLQAYCQLIQTLLSCPSGEEPEILAANTELLDADFVQVVVAAKHFAQQGEENTAESLRNLATYLTTLITQEDIDTYRQFLLKILRATAESNGDAQVIYPLLAANTDKLNDIFAELLRRRATNTLAEAEADAAYNAAVIVELSNLINQFPLGSKANNIEIAITGYEIALTVYTRSAFPEYWATVQNNLGNAYRERILGERAENIELAIAAYNNALLVYTHTTFPHRYVETLFNLGIVYQKSQRLISAYITLESAIETIELLSREIVDSEQTKPDVAEQWNQVYHSIVEVCLELKEEYTEAIEYIELTKTRKLIKSLLPKIQSEIDAEKRKLQKLEKDNQDNISLKNLRYLRQQKEYLVSRLDRFNPIRFSEIQNILNNETVIIQFYIFCNCFCAFIITRNNDEPDIWLFNQQDIDALNDWKNKYLIDYDAKDQDKTQWQNQLEERLKKLAEILHIEKIIDLVPEQCKRLILIPHRYLHLFPLHALPVKESYLIDLFPNGVGYAPSCQILQQVQLRQRPNFQSFFAIQNPTGDLYQGYEKDLGAVAAIKKQFTDANILKQDQANKSAILLGINENIHNVTLNEKLLKANCAFFFCHGYFNFASPQDSGLQLADGNLTLADIITHFKLENCRLVTLSACETGLTDFTSTSDEYIGLPSGFLLAGSTNVVSSLWTVSATATALLMIKFYEELQQQSNIVLALNTAQRWLRDTTVKGFQYWLINSSLSWGYKIYLKKYFAANHENALTKPFESPFYWAAFCNIGRGV